MANWKLIVFLALNLAAMVVFAASAAVVGGGARDNKPSSGAQLKAEGGSSGSQPDFWLGFIEWPGMAQFKPMLVPLQQTVGQVTQPLTAQIISGVPMSSQFYDQFNNMGAQLTNAMGAGAGGGSGGSGSGFSLGQLIPQGG